MPQQSLARITVVVNDYDEAIQYYTQLLGFNLIEDTVLDENDSQGRTKRWVVVAPPGSECELLLARAANENERQHVGNQTGGRVSFFLYTNDFANDYERYKNKGVEFLEDEPRVAPYGTVIVFRDICGNLWDLLQPK